MLYHGRTTDLFYKDVKTGSSPGVWELTVLERRNAVTFFEYTTVRPFIFMGQTFKCFYCLQYFSDVEILLDHTATHKTPDKNTLLQKYITKNKRSLQVDISALNCKLCDGISKDLDEIRLHLAEKHGVKFYSAGNAMTGYYLQLKDGLFSCHRCNERFHTFFLLSNHMNTHVGRVVCESCGAAFLNQRLLIKHREQHDLVKLHCKECDKQFNKKSQLRYHTQVLHKGKRVKEKKCPHCQFEFKEHSTKMVHLRDAHGITFTFSCHICKCSFPTRRSLTQHTNRFHTDKFKCELCSKCFGMKCQLDQHRRGHTGERSFTCPICKNAFMHRMTLAKHIKRVHGANFPLVCSQCAVGFNDRSDLDQHVKQWHSK